MPEPKDRDRANSPDETASAAADAATARAAQQRQPAQVTAEDVAAAKRHPQTVPPPGLSGPGEGPSS